MPRRPPTPAALLKRGTISALEARVLAHMRAGIYDEERLTRSLFGLPRGTLIASSWQAAAAFAPVLQGRATEALAVAMLNQRGMLLGEPVILTTGSRAATVFDPAQILHHVLTKGGGECASFIVAHNHPSGNTTPSWEDITATKKMQAAAAAVRLNLHDSLVIVDGGGFSSLAELGHMAPVPLV